MKTSKKWFIVVLVVVAFVVFVVKAQATAPILSISGTSGTDSAVVSVTGDPNASVTFYYYSNINSGIQNRYLGTTNNAGFFSLSISAGNYGINPGSLVYVIVNGQQSASLTWPTSSSSSSFYLSQTNLSLYVGQTSILTAYNTYGIPFLYNNSNPSIATATINSNSISIYGQSNGNTTMTFCQSGNTGSCGTIYVSVGGSSSSNGTLALNISNLTLPVGSSATISAVNSTRLYISNNSNSNIVSASSAPSNAGCTTNSLYSITTGLPCLNYNSNYNTSSYNNTSSYLYVPGCIPTSQYSITTGQPCFNNYLTNSSESITISALSAGTSTILLCQSNVNVYGTNYYNYGNNYGNNCGTVYVTVTGSYYANPSAYYQSSITNTDYSTIPIVYSH